MKNISLFCFLCVLCGVAGAQPASNSFDITKFGAVGDRSTLATTAINKAIDAANEKISSSDDQVLSLASCISCHDDLPGAMGKYMFRITTTP